MALSDILSPEKSDDDGFMVLDFVEEERTSSRLY